MLRPSASAAKESALAIESISASLRGTSGNSNAAAAIHEMPRRARLPGRIRAIHPNAGVLALRVGQRPTVLTGGGLPISAISGFSRGGPAEKAVRDKHQ